MPLISRIPEFMAERDLTASKLQRAVIEAGYTFHFDTATALRDGEIPDTRRYKGEPSTLDKLCDTYKKQPSEFILWEEGNG